MYFLWVSFLWCSLGLGSSVPLWNPRNPALSLPVLRGHTPCSLSQLTCRSLYTPWVVLASLGFLFTKVSEFTKCHASVKSKLIEFYLPHYGNEPFHTYCRRQHLRALQSLFPWLPSVPQSLRSLCAVFCARIGAKTLCRKCLYLGFMFAFFLHENLGSKLSSFPSSNLTHHSAERDMSNVNAGAMSLLFFLFSWPE